MNVAAPRIIWTNGEYRIVASPKTASPRSTHLGDWEIHYEHKVGTDAMGASRWSENYENDIRETLHIATLKKLLGDSG